MAPVYKDILLIDNFDSFTYNLVDAFEALGCRVAVFRNTAPLEALRAVDFDLLVLSPGPGVPRAAGRLFEIIEEFYPTKPIFGVCLGQQALIEFFGGALRHEAPAHGLPAAVHHDGAGIFTGLQSPAEMGRYHSLVAAEVPACFETTARTAEGLCMAVRHKQLPIEGVQFHPESVLSMRGGAGARLLANVAAGRLSTGNVGYLALMRALEAEAELPASALQSFVAHLAEGQLSEDQKLVLLVALSYRLREPRALAAFCEALLAAGRLPQFAAYGPRALDVCGTGGSGLPRINTSTLTALLLASQGVPVLKHGNRAATGRFGSFDLLAALGLPVAPDGPALAAAFEATGLGFILAPSAHPAVREFAGSRARMAIPTLFNVLGPLLNPARPAAALIGTAFGQYAELMLDTSLALGRQRVAVVAGAEGLDEISASGPTRVWQSIDGARRDYTLTPEDFGVAPVPFSEVKAETPADAQRLAEALLAGRLEGEHYRLVALNAAFAYARLHHLDMPLPEAYAQMADALASGAAGAQFAKLRLALTAPAPALAL